MENKIIYGSEIAKNIRNNIKREIEENNFSPSLAVIFVGDNPASSVYVKQKEKACEECSIKSLRYKLDENSTEQEILDLIDKLNKDKDINAILVQLPLPKHLNELKIINAIAPEKDVDCFHPLNVGKMFINKEKNLLLPCTPKGCIILIKSVCSDLSGKKAVVVGRSNIVGKPVSQLLLNENCSVEILHSKTQNIVEEIKTADIVVMAIGKQKFLKKEMIKEGAIVIDVGINRMENGKLCGDVDFDDVIDKVSYITPVPKGVGPMTVACLMENTLLCYKQQNNLE